MHQEHNIPWNSVASHLQFIRDNESKTPPRTDFFPRERPSQAKELNHFTRIFTKTLSTFAETERTKYPTAKELEQKATLFTSGKLFSDEVRDRHPDYLNAKNQLIENWISRATFIHTEDHTGRTTTQYRFTMNHGDLADAVKALIDEGEMETLLMLVHHPQVPIQHLHHLNLGHYFGFARVAEAAIPAYIYLNVVVAAGCTHNYRDLKGYQSLLQLVADTMHMDYGTHWQDEHHWRILGRRRSSAVLPDVLADLSRAKLYMKELFQLLYRYEVIVLEFDADPQLDREVISQCIHLSRRVEIHCMISDGEHESS
ncbi:hypothetical protein HGRIS_000655 [Hohenbuehelia grisea]|uniref:Uncharacterized protein n=1 Tax=Hohenbuehelia grisea TaxID=104357 RepID=A0ABR3JTL5_9AGAR